MGERLFPLTHNTSIFFVQTVISMSVIAITGYLLIDGRSPSIFLPVLAATASAWLPSPSSNIKQSTQPQNLIQLPQTNVPGTNTHIHPDSQIHPLSEIKIETPPDKHDQVKRQIANIIVHPGIVNQIHEIIKQNGLSTSTEEIANTLVHPEIVNKINNLVTTQEK